jgi:hypothetical protein
LTDLCTVVRSDCPTGWAHLLPGLGLICQNAWKGWHESRSDNAVARYVTPRMTYATRTRMGRCWRPVLRYA